MPRKKCETCGKEVFRDRAHRCVPPGYRWTEYGKTIVKEKSWAGFNFTRRTR